MTSDLADWSSTMEDSPFAVKDWESLRSSSKARHRAEARVQRALREHRTLVSGMRGWRVGTRAALSKACDTAPLCREVELLRTVADEIWAASQSVHQAVAASLERETDRLEETTLRWLREGGQWDWSPGPLPVWRELTRELLDEPWPVREAEGTLKPRSHAAYFELLGTVRHISRKDRPMRTSFVRDGLRRPAPEGKFFEACELVHDSWLDVAQSANVQLADLLERALDGVEAAARGLWETGAWEPPPRPRLIWC